MTANAVAPAAAVAIAAAAFAATDVRIVWM